MPQSQSKPPAPVHPHPPTPPRSRLRRWLPRIALILVVLYLLGGIGLYLLQPKLVFPGTHFQGAPSAVITPAAGEQLVHLRTPGGPSVTALYGLALAADGSPRFDADRCPTLIYFYGNNECTERVRPLTDLFRRQGLNVLVPDYLGYGMSEGEATAESFYATADAAYDYLVKDRGVLPVNIIVTGRSLGGAAAVHVASSRPVGGLITFSTFTRLSEVSQRILPIYPARLMLKRDFDNETKMKDVRCPVLVIHGTEDALVPFAMAGRLAAAAGPNARRIDVPGADHNHLFIVAGWPLIDQVGQFARGER